MRTSTQQRPLLAGGLALSCAILAVATPTISWARARTADIGEEQSKRYLLKAARSLKGGNEKAAEGYLERAISANPKNVKAVKTYAALLLKRKRFEETAKVLKAGLSHNPGDPQLGAYQAVYFCWTGEPEKALSTFKKVEGYIAATGAMQFLVAECLLYNGRYSLAEQTLKKSLKTTVKTRLEFARRMRYATALLALKKYKLAKQQIEHLEQLKPTHPQVVDLRAQLLLNRRYCTAALMYYQKLSRRSGPHLVGWAQANFCTKRYQKARQLASRYLKTRQDYLDSYLSGAIAQADARIVQRLGQAVALRGAVSLKRRRYQTALGDFALAKKLIPKDRSLDTSIAHAHYLKGDYRKCLDRLNRSIDDPHAGPQVVRLALRASLKLGAVKNLATLTAKLLRFPHPTARDSFVAGHAFAVLGKHRHSVKVLSEGLEKAPRWKNLQRLLGKESLKVAKLEATGGRLDPARKILERVVGLTVFKQNPTAHHNLALVYLKLNDFDKALKHGQLASNFDRSLSRRIVARSLIGLKQYKKAASTYLSFLKTVSANAKREVSSRRIVREELALTYALSRNYERALKVLGELSQDSTGATIERNRPRIHFAYAQHLKSQHRRTQMAAQIQAAYSESTGLSTEERAAILARSLTALVGAKRSSLARKIAKKERTALREALVESLQPLSQRLWPILVMMHSTEIADQQKAATSLLTLMRGTSGQHRTFLKQLAVRLLRRAAHGLLVKQKGKPALRILRIASKVTGDDDIEVKHNLAVATYYAGRTKAAMGPLMSITGRLPLAWCNMAVIEQNRGRPEQAFHLFKTCKKHGVTFPRLDRILELKQSIFGESSALSEKKNIDRRTGRQAANGSCKIEDIVCQLKEELYSS